MAFDNPPSFPDGVIEGVSAVIAGLPVKAGIVAIAVLSFRIVVLTGLPLNKISVSGLRKSPLTVTSNGATPGVTLAGTTKRIRLAFAAAILLIAESARMKP